MPWRTAWLVSSLALHVPVAQSQVAAFSVTPAIVDAGGLYDMQYTFTAGAGGFGRGGGVRIEIPVAYAETESLLWSAPHTDRPWAPGFVSATVTGGPAPRMQVAGLLRGIVEAEFVQAVPAGARITIHYRGQAQGLAGDIDARYQWRANGTAPWSSPDRVPRITVRPARAELVSASYPSDIVRNAPFPLVLVVLDRFGNLATGFTGVLRLRATDAAARVPDSVTFRPADRGRVVVPDAVFGTSGFQKAWAVDPASRLASAFKYAMVSDTAPALLHLFGDTHFHTGTGAESRGFFTTAARADVNTTGTGTFKALNLAGDHRANFTRAGEAYTYARDVMHLDFASTSEHSAPLLTPAAWRGSQDVSDRFNAPGHFTTFYGFEWTPDLNHYVVMYRDRAGMPIGNDSLPDFPSLARALERQGVPALAIPHVSWPFRAHNIWQDSAGGMMRRIGELYSLWNSRHLVQPDDEPQLFEVGEDDPWSYQYAWKRGHRLGVIAASDNHLGHPGANNTSIDVRHSGGLAGVLAAGNAREPLWQALNGRATYATTGTQVYLDFTSDGHVMGSEYEASAPPRLAGRVAGTNRLARVEVVRLAGGHFATVYAANPGAETFQFAFVDSSAAGAAMYYLRVTQVDEYPGRLYSHSTAEMAWSSPIWVDRAGAAPR